VTFRTTPGRTDFAAMLAALLVMGCGAGGLRSDSVAGAPSPPEPTRESSVRPLATAPRGGAPTRVLARPVPGQSGGLAIYLPRLFEDGSLGLQAVARPIGLPDDPARDAIEQLIRGPTGDERAADYQFALSAHSRLRSVGVEAGTAMIDFESGIDRVLGRPFSELVYWSIVYTATEAPGVNRVALSYRGEALQEIGAPPFPVPAAATRADAPDWARPR